MDLGKAAGTLVFWWSQGTRPGPSPTTSVRYRLLNINNSTSEPQHSELLSHHHSWDCRLPNLCLLFDYTEWNMVIALN